MSDGLLPDDKWAYSDGQRDGAENEREAIVTWLRADDLAIIRVLWNDEDYADAIERGDHLGGDDE